MEQKVKVLVTDDEEVMRKLLSQILSASGFEVLTASNGKEAVESVKRNQPQVILLDLTMPELDGFEACSQIRKDSENHNIPIIMLTGRGEESAIVSALDRGADDYIGKPFKPEVLNQKINVLLVKAKTGTLPSQLFRKKLQTEQKDKV